MTPPPGPMAIASVLIVAIVLLVLILQGIAIYRAERAKASNPRETQNQGD